MHSRATYFFGKALASIRESPGVSILTVATVTTALTITGLYIAALQNIEGLALIWGRTAMLTVYLDDSLTPQSRDDLRAQLQTLPLVKNAKLIEPLEALNRFKARGPAAAALVEGVSADVLPAAVELHLGSGFIDLKAVAKLAEQAQSLVGVTEVDYGQQEFERLKALLRILRTAGIIAGFLIALATAFIISNTIKLTVYARRDEIGILRLVGATTWFVRLPFLFEGALWGLSGATLAASLLWLSDHFLAAQITIAVSDVLGGLNVSLYSNAIGGSIILVGTLLGVIGSALAVGRFLDEEQP